MVMTASMRRRRRWSSKTRRRSAGSALTLYSVMS
jgi:hypothetical protein